jgi:hypothetical protein
MNRKKPLGLPWGFAPAYLVFSLARRLMRDFCQIVSPAVLAVGDARQELTAGSTITPQVIAHKQPGNIAQSF